MIDRDDIYYINLIKSGNKGAFSYLVNRYSEMVYSLAFKMLKNSTEAEDLTQEIFIAIYKSINKFKGDSKFSTWVYRITYNRVVSKMRLIKPITFTDKETFLDSRVVVEKQPMEMSNEEEKIQLLQNCIKQLSDEEQLLIMFYYYEEQSIEEISKVTGSSTSNVKIKLYRSRKKLYEKMMQANCAFVF